MVARTRGPEVSGNPGNEGLVEGSPPSDHEPPVVPRLFAPRHPLKRLRLVPHMRLVALRLRSSMFCSLCGQHARHPKSPVPDLRRKECPRFPASASHAPNEVRTNPLYASQFPAGNRLAPGDSSSRERLRSLAIRTDPPPGVVHRGCCADEVCSGIDGRGHVRCMWTLGGREQLMALGPLHKAPRLR